MAFLRISSVVGFPAMASSMLSQPEWRWFSRDLERDINETVTHAQQVGRAVWLYVRGRRQTGKTQTVIRLLEKLQKHRYIKLVVGLELQNLTYGLGLDATCYPDLLKVTQAMTDMILDGVVIAIDEIQNASLTLQQLLQGVIDTVKGKVFQDRRVEGGLILLGSKPPSTDELVEGAGKPLWHRMTHHRTVTEFLPYEMERVFSHFNIRSGKSKVMIMVLTGSFPQLLERLAVENVMNDAIHEKVGTAIKAILKGTTELVDFLESEFGEPWTTIARIAICGKSPGDVLSDIEKKLPGEALSIATKLRLLDMRYGVIRLERPIIDGLKARGKPSCCYTVWDMRWYWYKALFDSTAITSVITRGVTLDVSQPNIDRFHQVAGKLMERLVADAAQLRPRYASETLPGWRLAADKSLIHFSKERPLSAPCFLRGRCIGFDGELDGVCLFVAEQIVVYLSCKLSSKSLHDEFSGLDSNAAFQFRTHSHVQELKSTLNGQPQSASMRSESEDCISSVICNPKEEHYLFVASDLTRDNMPFVPSTITQDLRERIWFASFNDILSFPSYNTPAIDSQPL